MARSERQKAPNPATDAPRAREGRRKNWPPPTLAAEVVSGDSDITIAKRHEVDRHVVRGWRKMPKVAAEIESLNAELAEASRQKLLSGRALSLDVLAAIAGNEGADLNVRVKAAGELGRLTAPKEPTKVELSTPDGLTVKVASMTEEELQAIIDGAKS